MADNNLKTLDFSDSNTRLTSPYCVFYFHLPDPILPNLETDVAILMFSLHVQPTIAVMRHIGLILLFYLWVLGLDLALDPIYHSSKSQHAHTHHRTVLQKIYEFTTLFRK